MTFPQSMMDGLRHLHEQQLKDMAKKNVRGIPDYPMTTGPLLDHHPWSHTTDDAIFCKACVTRRLLAEVLL